MRARRGLLALTITALAIGTISLPASAAGTTRWVDDDGKAGPGGCAGSATAKATIQAAVNAASAGDTILICPGTYPEFVNVGAAKDGLTIRGVKQWTAKITGTDLPEGRSLLHIAGGARNVTVRGLVFAWDAGTFNTAGFSECTLDAGIWVQGQHATILANRLRVKGVSFSPCGMVDGIRVGEPMGLDTAGPGTPASATISHNAVRDFVVHGITGVGAGVEVSIERNSIRYWHLGSFPRRRLARQRLLAGWGHQVPAGPGFESMGIAVGLGATGDVYGNEVSSGPDSQPILITGDQPTTPGLTYGITSAQANGVTVRGNTIRRTTYGISYIAVINGLIRANATIDHGIGIQLVASDGNRVRANQVGPGFVGISIDTKLFTAGIGSSSENNRVIDNTVFGHTAVDCVDTTTGPGTLGTANTWEGNAGFSSDPSGLCLAF